MILNSPSQDGLDADGSGTSKRSPAESTARLSGTIVGGWPNLRAKLSIAH